MPYLVDGHNLIGQMTDIDLGDPDDEARLISRLRAFCARTGRKATVYFDRGSPGSQTPSSAGGLRIVFVARPRTADEAIYARLAQLGGEARNWTVVSSDRQVQRAAERAGAKSMSSPDFADRLLMDDAPLEESEKPQSPSSEEDIARWERIFRRRGRSD
jgi:predicted RNA-binding protein with PIN domain